MLNFIAEELHYFGINRVVDVSTRNVSWASTLQVGERSVFYGAGISPDAALANVLEKAGSGNELPTLDTTLTLDQLTDDLLQLVITRFQTSTPSGALWSGVGRFHERRRFWLFGPLKRPGTIRVTALMPDEVLNEIIRQAFA
jgi:hypothetical protein